MLEMSITVEKLWPLLESNEPVDEDNAYCMTI